MKSKSTETIKIFLESPKTQESASEADLMDYKNTMISLTKEAGLKSKKSKRKERLPPYIPYKSIYSETDFSKLTERQRILVLKYQTNKSNLSSLFLAVNDINNGEPNQDLIESNIKTEKKSSEKSVKEREVVSVVDETIYNENLVETMANKRKNFTRKTIAPPVYCCNNCYSELEDLQGFLAWLQNKHSCKLRQTITNLLKNINFNLEKKRCVCKREERLYTQILNISNKRCCGINDQVI